MALPYHWMSDERGSSVLFPFLTMQGTLLPAQPTFDRVIRPGVDGIAVWSMGSRGEPFSITTTLDCVSVAAAGAAFFAYGRAVLTKKDLYYCNGFWGTMMIQSVIMQSVTKFAAGVGGVQGFSGGSGALLTVQWQVETLPQQSY